MSVPETLKEQIDFAYRQMNSNSQYELKPIYRRNIYNLIRSSENGWKVQGWLACLTSRRALSAWQTTNSSYLVFYSLVEAIEKTLKGEITRVEAEIYLENASVYLYRVDELGEITSELISGIDYMIQVAIRHAWGESYDDDPFGDADIEEDNVEEDLGEYRDTAAFTLWVFAKDTIDPASNPRKRKEFWQWWLTEAIPQAWELANPSST